MLLVGEWNEAIEELRRQTAENKAQAQAKLDAEQKALEDRKKAQAEADAIQARIDAIDANIQAQSAEIQQGIQKALKPVIERVITVYRWRFCVAAAMEDGVADAVMEEFFSFSSSLSNWGGEGVDGTLYQLTPENKPYAISEQMTLRNLAAKTHCLVPVKIKLTGVKPMPMSSEVVFGDRTMDWEIEVPAPRILQEAGFSLDYFLSMTLGFSGENIPDEDIEFLSEHFPY